MQESTRPPMILMVYQVLQIQSAVFVIKLLVIVKPPIFLVVTMLSKLLLAFSCFVKTYGILSDSSVLPTLSSLIYNIKDRNMIYMNPKIAIDSLRC